MIGMCLLPSFAFAQTPAAGSAAAQTAAQTTPTSAANGAKLPNMLGGEDQTIQELIGVFIKFLFGFVGTLALVMFIWGGVQYILSMGNAEKVGKAKNTLIWAVYGLAMTFFAYAIVSLVLEGLSRMKG